MRSNEMLVNPVFDSDDGRKRSCFSIKMCCSGSCCMPENVDQPVIVGNLRNGAMSIKYFLPSNKKHISAFEWHEHMILYMECTLIS